MTLLEQIQNEVIDGSSDLATVLRKCRVLSAKLKNPAFTEWVINELDGYPDSSPVPDYRIIRGQPYGNFIGDYRSADGFQLGESEFDQKNWERFAIIHFRQGVEPLQRMLKTPRTGTRGLGCQWPPEALGAYRGGRLATDFMPVEIWVYFRKPISWDSEYNSQSGVELCS